MATAAAVVVLCAALAGAARAAPPLVLDLAAVEADARWLHHLTVGEPSFDALQRSPANPIFSGTPEFAWPVNGFLFGGGGGNQTMLVGLYGRGYAPPWAMLALSSTDAGASWQSRGIVMQGNASSYDRGGGTPDGSMVAFNGSYHLVFDWGTPNSLGTGAGDRGLGYAFGPSPTGPFVRSALPIAPQSQQPLLPPGYKAVYGGTLVRRASDWLIVAAMSTPGNSGGMWACVVMTAAQPEGPYSAAQLVVWPQSDVFHLHPCEFYPAFTHGGDLFVPCTSLAANRNMQVLYRVALEQATDAAAWRIDRLGSLWHDEGIAHEAAGIWGQTFTGFVDDAGARMHVAYPSKDAGDVGNINIGIHPWGLDGLTNTTTVLRRPAGFWVSAPNAPAQAIYPGTFGAFALQISLSVHGAGTQGFSVRWNHRGRIGPAADGLAPPAAASFFNNTALCFDNAGHWSLVQLLDQPDAYSVLASGSLAGGAPGGAYDVVVTQLANGSIAATVNGELLATSHVALPADAIGGGLAVHANQGLALNVSSMVVEVLDTELPAQRPWTLTPEDGMLAAGNAAIAGWSAVAGAHLRFGAGFQQDNAAIIAAGDAMVKWNFVGQAAQLWLPRGPAFGTVRVLVDGTQLAAVSLTAPALEPSAVVFRWEAGPGAPAAPHAIVVRAVDGAAFPVDTLDFWPQT